MSISTGEEKNQQFYAEQLKTNLLRLLNIYNTVLNNDFAITFCVNVIENMDSMDIMNYIVENIIQYKEKIKARDEYYILEQNPLLSGELSNNIFVIRFKYMWNNFDNVNKEKTWRYFDSFVKTSENFITVRRL